MNCAAVSKIRQLRYSLFVFSLTLELTSTIKYSKFTYQRFYQIADPRVGIDYFAKKLNFEGFVADRLIVKHTKPFADWLDEYKAIKESARNIDACSLKKTNPKMRAQDSVSKIGSKNCLEQCKMESEVYFEFLNNKLQKLIRIKFYKADVRIVYVPINNTKNIAENFYKCVRKGYKRYICECSHPADYAIESSEEFKERFSKILSNVYGLSPSPENWKILEKRFKMPIKLIAFLIIYHLLPKEILEFLIWWDTAENPAAYTTTTTTTVGPIFSDEEPEGVFDTRTTAVDQSGSIYWEKTAEEDSISSDQESGSIFKQKGNRKRKRRK